MRVIVHGGAGRAIRDRTRARAVREALHEVRDELFEGLAQGWTARETVVEGCRYLEDDPNFNAGTGSVLQSDGRIRMSAAMMDGETGRFSGIINAERLRHPIALADRLQASKDRVLAGDGATELMREVGVPIHDPVTEKRLGEWLEQRERDFEVDAADVVSGGGMEPGHGTIGVVAMDSEGRLAAGTSTGGRGFERIGRVSDSAMPAGNYVSPEAAVSCTGIGEDIIDECLAARIAVRVTDGLGLRGALGRSFEEAERRERSFGAIVIDAEGRIGWGKTSEILLAAWRHEDAAGDTMELPEETVVDVVTDEG